MSQVFFSYVEEDSRVVRQIADGLEAAGYTTWFYERDSNLPGVPHFIQSGGAIKQAEAFVLVVSPESLDHPRHVKKEVFKAANADANIIPLLLDVTYGEFQGRQPDWEDALAGAVAIPIPRDEPPAIVPNVVAALRKLGVEPTGAPEVEPEVEPEWRVAPAGPAESAERHEPAGFDVFLSYVAEDSPIAEELARRLEARGYRTWYYERDALPGASWSAQTARQIVDARVVVLVLSARSLDSPLVAADIARARGQGKPLIPLLRGITYEQIEHHSSWAMALASTVALVVPSEGLTDALVDRLIGGLRVMGVEPRKRMRIELVQGDITDQEVDAIVTPAHPSLLGGGWVDGAIHQKGGPALLEETEGIREERYPDGLPTGEAVATTAGRLKAKWVIHTVGPVYSKEEDRSGLLARCHTESLRIADDLGARSVAFPAISTGAYGYPVEEAARIAIEAVREAETNVELVRFVLFDPPAYGAFERALRST